MAFFQDAPSLGNQFTDDRVLRSYLARALPPDVHRAVEPELRHMGELAGGELFTLQAQDRLNEPRLTQWDAWGHRIDQVDLTPMWQRARRLACEAGVVATAYERKHARFSRIHQFALAYLFDPSTDTFSCPLAMTDGAARTLIFHKAAALIDRAVPRLTSRDPGKAWTSGQWMTERTGGSDVALSEAIARQVDGQWRLYGTKWFTSAVTSEMALTLASPEGAKPGGRALALFYVETRGPNGIAPGLFVNRLKDKLGTRKLPTGELTLDGLAASPVTAELGHGIKAITPMLTITRTWNAVCSAAGMRRGLALARDYGRRRAQFGAPLAQKPLHQETVAGLQAEAEGAFHLAFRAVELLGRDEAKDISERDAEMLRLITPLAKLCTARQMMVVMPEVLEVFGGAGYLEDTGIARLLRDGQVLPIWEGTTNVLALDVLRALSKGVGSEVYLAEIEGRLAGTRSTPLAGPAKLASATAARAFDWVQTALKKGPDVVEAGARGLALTLARTLELALLVQQGQWSIDNEHDGRGAAAAVRLARHGVDWLVDPDAAAAALADDRPLPA